MNYDDAVAALDQAGVPADAYGLDTMSKDNAYILYRCSGQWWETFYIERGIRSSVRRFASEDAACRAFVTWVLGDLKLASPSRAADHAIPSRSGDTMPSL